LIWIGFVLTEGMQSYWYAKERRTKMRIQRFLGRNPRFWGKGCRECLQGSGPAVGRPGFWGRPGMGWGGRRFREQRLWRRPGMRGRAQAGRECSECPGFWGGPGMRSGFHGRDQEFRGQGFWGWPGRGFGSGDFPERVESQSQDAEENIRVEEKRTGQSQNQKRASRRQGRGRLEERKRAD
jgi:hypothetical protein